VIKIYVRAIVPTINAYVLMGEPDKSGEVMWDLPGGALEAGKDIRQLLQKLVLQNTGYTISDLKFFEIACRVQPKSRTHDPLTIVDFIFIGTVDAQIPPQEAQKQVELLPYEKFEWLDSAKHYNMNKVMNVLSRYHGKTAATHDNRLNVDVEPTVI
jgi:ADP-ribose pyrophosphatase YjhB (NUDIX family)